MSVVGTDRQRTADRRASSDDASTQQGDPEISSTPDIVIGFDIPSKDELRRINPPRPDERIWKDHAELFEAENDALVRYARALMFGYQLPNHLAEDVVQDAWADLIARWDSIDRPLPWMYVVVKNKAARQAEQKSKQSNTDIRTASECASWISHPPTASLDTIVAVHETIREIAALPDQQRMAAYLRFVEGREYSEIANLMEIDTGTVGAHLHRARNKLRSRLGNFGTYVLILAAMIGVVTRPIHTNPDQGEQPDSGQDVPISPAASHATPSVDKGDLATLSDKMAQLRASLKQATTSLELALTQALPEFTDSQVNPYFASTVESAYSPSAAKRNTTPAGSGAPAMIA